MKKRGLSDILTILIVMVLILLLVSIIWIIIDAYIKRNLEETELRSKMLSEEIGIDDVDVSDYQVNITLKKGPGREILINETIIKKNSSVVFVMDTTGSMGNELLDVKNIIEGFSEKLDSKNVNAKIGLVEFRDYPTSICGQSPQDFPYKIWSFGGSNFTYDPIDIKNVLNSIILGAGADNPESHLSAIEQAINLDYSGVDLKFIIVLTDAPPHAQDCLCTGALDCYSRPGGGGTPYPYYTYVSCYLGPKNISQIIEKLNEDKIILYYINQISGLCNNEMDKNLAIETGGRFFDYEETEGVEEILLKIGDQIIREYETITNWNYLSVKFYNGSEVYEYKIYDLPRVLETKTYSIIIEDYISNVNKIEVYPVAISSRGDKVIGQRVGFWEQKQGVFASLKSFFGFS